MVFALFVFLHGYAVSVAAYSDVAKVDVPATPLLVTGMLVATAGALLFLWATSELARRGRFVGTSSTRLVTSGPFRRLDHPQYAGWTVVLFGIAIASRSLIALALVVAFALLVVRYVRAEDRQLARRFGDELTQHRSR